MNHYFKLTLIVVALMLAGCSSSNQISTQSVSVNSGSLQSTNQMTQSILTNKLSILSNELFVRDLAVMRDFYVNMLGFEVIEESADSLMLGNQGKILLKLIQRTEFTPRNSSGAGLYHIAYVHDTRIALANRLARIATYAPQAFQGSSDHSVSEAFYFVDPEGNGIELYFDRDPSMWMRSGGQVVMGSKYLDPNSYIQSYQSTGADHFHVGHNHLQVGDLVAAKKFYQEILGFDITQDMSSRGALFVSVGGYHHHFGLNVRNSKGASPRPEQQLGLGTMTISVENSNDIDRLEKRLAQNGISFTKKDQTIIVSDPWNNVLEFGIIN